MTTTTLKWACEFPGHWAAKRDGDSYTYIAHQSATGQPWTLTARRNILCAGDWYGLGEIIAQETVDTLKMAKAAAGLHTGTVTLGSAIAQAYHAENQRIRNELATR